MSLAKPCLSSSQAPITLSQMRVRLEYGDGLKISNLSPYASGSRYGGNFSIKCDEVQSAWP
jgi:hypothetical protein